MSVKIVKILSVNTSDNTFFCNFIITCKWEDQSFWPVVEGSVDRSAIDMKQHFVPEYDITNLVALSDGLVKEPQFDYYRRKDSNTVRVIMKQVRSGEERTARVRHPTPTLPFVTSLLPTPPPSSTVINASFFTPRFAHRSILLAPSSSTLSWRLSPLTVSP